VHQLHYQHPGTWFGDCMPVFAEGAFQLFHQRDTRRPGPFGEPFGWALVRTTDFVGYEDLGEVVERGADDAQDQFIFAGSVLAARGGYHAFYTGFNRDYAAQGRAAQVLMHAVSDDLVSWRTIEGELVPPRPGYDPDNWRDPFDGRGYYAARSASDGEHRYLFGWVATKEGERDAGGWQWGGTLVVHQVRPRPDGSLAVAIPETVRGAFGPADELIAAPTTVSAADGRTRCGGRLPHR
jgi:hypothetical protein